MTAPAGYRILRLGPQEAERAATALDALLPEDWRDGPVADAAQMTRALAAPGAVLLLAEREDGTAAGYVSGLHSPSVTARGDTVMLDDLLVAEADRGKGLGTALVCAFRAVMAAEAARPAAMWGGTGLENLACDGAFRSAGGVPEGEIYREYRWPTLEAET